MRRSVCRAHPIMKSEIERRRHRRAVSTLGRLVFTTLGPLTLSLVFAAYSPPAHADTITVFGTPGTGGVSGPIGTDGGPGGGASAAAGPNNDSSNTASATGGAGGPGGASITSLRLVVTEDLAGPPSRSRPPAQPMALATVSLRRLLQAAQAALPAQAAPHHPSVSPL
jgi:hypothetical protein